MWAAVSVSDCPARRAFAVGGDDEADQLGAHDAVAHPVEDREPGDAAVDRVVQGVAGHLVGRLQRAGERDGVVDERQRRQQGPLDLRGEGHRAGTSGPDDAVAVQGLGQHQLGDHRGEPLQARLARPVVHRRVRHRDAEDPEAFGPVEQRQPEPGGGAGGGAGRLALRVHLLERPARDGGVDAERAGVVLVTVGRREERHEDPLLQVREVDDGVLATEERRGLRDQRGDRVRGCHVGVADQPVEPEGDPGRPRRPVRGRPGGVRRRVVVGGHVQAAYEKLPPPAVALLPPAAADSRVAG